MAEQVVTELVIEADTSGATKYEQAMDSAANAAGRGVSSNSEFSLSFAAIGAGAVAAVVGIKSMMDSVVSANHDLAGLNTIAKQVGLTLSDMQGIKLGGAIAGLTDSQINTGLEKSSSLLNDAQRNANSLSKELNANGISVKNANGQLISQNQLLGIAANLISNAKNPGDQLAIAQMLGFTKEWIPLLEQGAGAMTGLTDEAKKAGAVIDDETIKRATEFDSEWRKTTAIFAANLKAAIADALPYIDDMIKKGSDFITAMKNARPEGAPPSPFLDDSNPVDRTVRNAVRGGLNAVGINPDAGIEIKLAPEVTQGWSNFTDTLQQKFNDLQSNASDGLKKQIEDLDAWWHEKAIDPAFVANGIPRLLNFATNGAFPAVPVGVSTFSAPTVPYASDDPMNGAGYPKSGPKNFNDLQKQKDWADDAAGDAADQYSKVAAKDVPDDAVDRANNSLRKHTELQIADTQAIGLGDAALASFRAEAAHTAAVKANDGEETAQQAAEYLVLKKNATEAAQALAQAKIDSSISVGRQTAFLTPQDVQIASQLKGLYGNDVPAALASSEAAALRLNASIKDVSDTSRDMLKGFASDFRQSMESGKGAWDSFAAAGVNALNKIADKLSSMAIDKLWSSAFGGSSGGSLLSMFGISGGGSVGSYGQVSNATGLGAGTGGLSFPMFADGTDSAPGGWSIIGERGPEKMFVPQGAKILPNGTPRPDNDNGGSVMAPVSISIDATGADAAGLARVQEQLISLQTNLPATIVKTVQKAKTNRILS